MIIDIHGHVTAPAELYAYKAGLLSHRGWHGRGGLNISDEELERALTTPVFGGKSHLEQLKEVGTDLQLISPRPYQMMHSEKPERIVRWWIEENNNLIARQCKLHPEVFRGVAGLPQYPGRDLKDAIEELERCVKELGFVGCLLNPDPTEGEGPPPPGLGDEYWYPLYEKLVELDVPALVHSASCRSPRESYSLHFVNEESIAIISLLSSRVFQDFPTLKLVISHGGGAIPYQLGRFRATRIRQRHPEPFEEAMRKLYYDTCLYSKEALELLFKVVGPDRCLFGTERPGTGTALDPVTGRWTDDLKPVIESIEWLTDADRKKIFEDNAKALYKLQVGAPA
ncbi:MAG TPA: amidohydrolase family protein [Chloroflexota bacterium]|jgi:predicted TIM-barrel fold metal-dependent hydrolase|nr:amidohydrolase family protein [Chloroflexota bacterium]